MTTHKHHRRRRPGRLLGTVLALFGLFAAFVALLAVEATIAARRMYLPDDPGYEVDYTVTVPAAQDDGNASGKDAPLQMAMLGDSTVASLGAPTERDSLPVQTAQHLSDMLERDVRVVGFGISGADTRDVIDNQIAALRDRKLDLDLLVIEIGSNEVTHLTPPWKVEELTLRMLRDARAAAPDAAIVLGSAGKLNTTNFAQPLRAVVVLYATRVRAAQERAATEANVGFMDVAREVSPEYDRTPGAASSDLFHPSPTGYDIWGKALAVRAAQQLAR